MTLVKKPRRCIVCKEITYRLKYCPLHAVLKKKECTVRWRSNNKEYLNLLHQVARDMYLVTKPSRRKRMPKMPDADTVIFRKLKRKETNHRYYQKRKALPITGKAHQ